MRCCRYARLASEHSGWECVVSGIKYINAAKPSTIIYFFFVGNVHFIIIFLI